MSDQYLGEIRMVGFNFAPQGWALCNGQILAISQNAALFSLLGTTYGGNGQTTFALPNLQSRVPVHQGQGQGLSSYTIGEMSGVESVTLIQTQMPLHSHTVAVTVNAAYSPQSPTDNPSGAVPAGTSGGPQVYNSASDGTTMSAQMVAATITPAGGSQPHENRQPYLCINFIIALTGIFPSRN